MLPNGYKHFDWMIKRYQVIHIPYYQREYVWGTRNEGQNLYKFIDDIIHQYIDDSTTDYFIGTLAFCSEKPGNGYDVIDGQQRITSLILLLSEVAKKCSKDFQNKNHDFLFPAIKGKGKVFIIQEEHYLTKELLYNLEHIGNFSSQGENANISSTIDRIDTQLNRLYFDSGETWFEGLYSYIMTHISFIWLEYPTIAQSLKYFLNINSLSITLSQSDIFFSILSESLRISNNLENIYNIKDKIYTIVDSYKDLKSEISSYKVYDRDEIAVDNIIYIFLNAYYQNHPDILKLDSTGIGKWMSIYENDVFNNEECAEKFSNRFVSYLNDFETLCKYFVNKDGILNKYTSSSLFASSSLIRYFKYPILVNLLNIIFKNRHNFIDGKPNLYDISGENIDTDKLNEIAKRLNLTILSNCVIKNKNNLLVGLDNSNSGRTDGYLTIDENGNYCVSINEIVREIDLDNLFALEYKDKNAVSDDKHDDDHEIIKLIFACQEAYLDFVSEANKEFRKTFNEFLSFLLESGFTVEHMFSVNEYKNTERREKWKNTYPNSFTRPEEFDNLRFKFENLSLLHSRENSSANDDSMKSKINEYRNASGIFGGQPEFLIQSLAEDSAYYRDLNIQELHLPSRCIVLSGETWQHSDKNRDFNKRLFDLAIKELADE